MIRKVGGDTIDRRAKRFYGWDEKVEKGVKDLKRGLSLPRQRRTVEALARLFFSFFFWSLFKQYKKNSLEVNVRSWIFY